ncbi:MAG: chloride transporter [Sulfurovum sp. FS08-3]|nr:MAG: chloride transporter [Sulfurovum sp. FS08-3]
MTLEKLRKNIDKLDDEILTLLNKRMEYVHQVGELKGKDGGAIYRPEREQAIMERLTKLSQSHNGLLQRKHIEAIFYEIIGISKSLERDEKVAYLGPIGTFTHQAAQSRFGSIKDYNPYPSILSVFKAVSSDSATYGVVPIENSTDGVVGETLDLLGEYNLNIVAEIYMPIHHSFATKVANIGQVRKIYSKDKAFGQCREFLENHGLMHLEHISVESTAKAAQLAAKDSKAAAICLHIAAKMNKLPILYDNIEDRHDNKTRFIVVSKSLNLKGKNDKTSILARLSNTQGSLVRFLQEFDEAGINLTKIESRPAQSSKAFSYWFYIDFDGHIEDENIKQLLARHEDIKFLGSYTKADDEI